MASEQNERGLVLIVEDDPYTRRTLAQILEEEGYPVAMAANGRDALQRLQERPLPCLVLLDLLLPGMSGWEFREECRKDPELGAVPVVLLSGTADVHKQVAVTDADGYLRKPIDPRILLEIVKGYCG